jgi:nitrogen fixation protein NifU and related proteins
MIKELYPPHLLDHYRNPRHWGVLENPDISSGMKNPSCGDQIQIFGRLEGDRLTAVSFIGQGCVLSQAAASLLTEAVLGKTITQIKNFSADDMQRLVAIPVGPLRRGCIMLALEALQEALTKKFS